MDLMNEGGGSFSLASRLVRVITRQDRLDDDLGGFLRCLNGQLEAKGVAGILFVRDRERGKGGIPKFQTNINLTFKYPLA